MPLIDAGFLTKEGKADGELLVLYGPTTTVLVCGIELPEDPKNIKTKSLSALIDSGASHSCIDIGVAQELELIQVDVVTIAGVGGAKNHPVYLAYMFIPQLDIIQYGQFTGVELKSGGQTHDALLGRDFLKNVIMIYDGIRSQVTISSMQTQRKT